MMIVVLRLIHTSKDGLKYKQAFVFFVLVWCVSFSHCSFRKTPRFLNNLCTQVCVKIVSSLDKTIRGGLTWSNKEVQKIQQGNNSV